ncbi:N-acetylmuramoyl-L-alanine amidase [Clostridium sediminicola]|uniref:peptidoglycan recognition protein family protein n=1 Tax=Clostridium sediminicola TaxID=3114879 RepID=UPI0031F1FE4E
MNVIDSNLVFMSNMRYGNKPNKIILHHAASSCCSIRDIHYWHLNKGWAGCGYHFFIRKDGSVYKGRDENVVGAHCKGYNTGSIGICVEGNFMVETMPDVEKKAVVEVCRHIMGKYSITNIYGHNNFVKTDCPGNSFPFQEIINEVFNDSTAKDLYLGYLIKKNNCKYDRNVVKIQQRLAELGYDVGECGVDGYFGEDTERAVRKYQEDVGIMVDGVVGEVTWGRLFVCGYIKKEINN